MSDNKICKTTITSDGVTYDFSDGRTLTCNARDIPEATLFQAALFGIRRKVGNSFADVKGNVDEAFNAAKETWAQLVAGQWTAPRESAGTTTTRGSEDLLAAVAAITGKPVEALAEKLAAMSKAQRAELRKNDQVASKLLEIRAARLAAKGQQMDVGSLFAD